MQLLDSLLLGDPGPFRGVWTSIDEAKGSSLRVGGAEGSCRRASIRLCACRGYVVRGGHPRWPRPRRLSTFRFTWSD